MTADSTPLGTTDTREGPRWALFAIITSTFAVLCSAFLLLSSVPWENDGAASNDALTWDGLTAMLSTLLSAGIAGGVAAWVLTVQNRKQAELQREANRAQQEEARKAREIQAAADLAEHIDTKWQLFRSGQDVDAHLGSTYIPVEEIPHLRRLANIWTAHLREDLIVQAGIQRGDIVDAVLTFAEALEWSDLHHDRKLITSKDPEGRGHNPWTVASNGQWELAKIAHHITVLPTAPRAQVIEQLQWIVRNGKALGRFGYDVPQKPRPTLGMDT